MFDTYMWCDQAKSVWSRPNSVFIFLTNCVHHFQSYICRKPHWNWSIGSKDMSSWRMPKTKGNKRDFLICLALSKHQYFRLPTDFAWSHIFMTCDGKTLMYGIEQKYGTKVIIVYSVNSVFNPSKSIVYFKSHVRDPSQTLVEGLDANHIIVKILGGPFRPQ